MHNFKPPILKEAKAPPPPPPQPFYGLFSSGLYGARED